MANWTPDAITAMARVDAGMPGSRGLKRAWIAGVVLALAAHATFAATPPQFNFTRIDSRNGLAQGSIRAMLQDGRGYIWLGTESGLHRYDGYTLKVFQHDPERADSLPDNTIMALADAPGDDLWVATSDGSVLRFDASHNRVRSVIDHADDDLAVGLFADAGARLWVGRGDVIRLFAPPYDDARDIYHLRQPLASLHQYGAIRFAQCPDGALYAATNDGVVALDTQSAHVLDGSGPATGVWCDQRNRLFASRADGLAEIDRATGTRRDVWTNTGNPAATPGAVVEDAHGWLWLSLDAAGLLRVRPDGRDPEPIDVHGNAPGFAPGLNVSGLLIDRSGLLWIGTRAHGILLTDPAGSAVQRISNLKLDANITTRNDIRAIYVDGRNDYWLGTPGAGLLRYTPGSTTWTDFSAPLRRALNLPSTARLTVYAVAPAAAGALWVATRGDVLHFDPANGRARRLDLGTAVGDATPVRDIFADRDGSLWLASIGHGLLHYRDGVGVIRRYGARDGLPDAGVMRVMRDHAGQLWVGTLSGVARFDPITQHFRAFREDPQRADSLAGHHALDLASGRDGNLWIATDGGVNRLLDIDAAGAHFRRYLQAGHQADSTAYCIIDDGQGHLWVSTNLGITRLDPATGATRVLSLEDGLQGLEFNSAACARDRNGALLFGGINGLNRFLPGAITSSGFMAPPVITSIEAGRQQFAADTAFSIPWDTRVVSFHFAALDYAAPHRNRFRYRLVGLDRGWVDSGTENRATYTNLAPGNYHFEVLASNRDGVFNPQAASATFRVLPPWWDTPLMRAAFALLAAIVLLAAWLAWHRHHLARRRHERELRESDERLRLALWASGDQFWDWDMLANTLHRVGASQINGNVPEQVMSVDNWTRHVVHPDDIAGVKQAAWQHTSGLTPVFESEHRVMAPDGSWFWVRARGKVVERDRAGNAIRMCGVVHNAGPERDAEHGHRVAAEVLRSMSEAVAVTDTQFRFVSINAAFSRMLGYGEDEIQHHDASLLNSHQHAAEVYGEARRALVETGRWRGELWQRRKDGEEFLAWLELSALVDPRGERTHFVCVMSDITERKRAEQELRYLASYDTLTGLPNRTQLVDQLSKATQRARQTGRKVAVLFIDLDRFKQVNDSLGHSAGDRILHAAGNRLRANVRDIDVVSRLGGDEFCVLLDDLAEGAITGHVCAALIAAFEPALHIEPGQEVTISPSIGVALYPDHGLTPAELLKHADTAMYQAKLRGRNTWVMYTDAMNATARRHAVVLNALRSALRDNELSVVYQPKLDLVHWEVTGVEALLRWHSRSLGEIPPSVFIPLAEEAGLIVDFGAFVLDQAAATLAKWREHDVTNVPVAVNVSSAQLLGDALVRHLRDVTTRHRGSAGMIELELTESLVMTDAETSLRTLGELKKLGARLAIDDFGTGYSSFSYLKRLPIDTLKIDKEFIGDITTDVDDEEITAAVISMAHSLGLVVVAEGVETRGQLTYLAQQGCDQIQGNWFSPPLPAMECLALLCRHDPATRPELLPRHASPL